LVSERVGDRDRSWSRFRAGGGLGRLRGESGKGRLTGRLGERCVAGAGADVGGKLGMFDVGGNGLAGFVRDPKPRSRRAIWSIEL
jgi:hypothetical protein